MPNLNKVMLMGNLTRDPELRFLPSGNAVVNVGMAINRRWKNPNGEQQEEVTYVDCEGFGKTAEVINQYLKKGRPIYIEGRLKLDQWQDKEGHNRSKIKIVIETFQFIDSRGGPGGEHDGGGGFDEASATPPPARAQSFRPAPSSPGRPPAARPPASPPPSGDPHQPVEEEDIPF